ncbi:xylulokinase [Cerasicoccus arenae]|uniref:Xylulose kinase n=1 Tax=Cerasicoccus arenae TaxID=424488 RepID=A0A8J3DD00_9BACT|nr:xylulokinase [Cerasicoccus arenae]MBK1859647.1 xylulokinase [Cerasicoccus arenae]GHC07453.1 xylulokinase [Cerasicoccus arenae]
MPAYLIGIDVGTSSAKTLVMDERGNIVFTIAPEYDFATPRPGWAECNPEDWWTAILAALKAVFEQTDVRAEDIAGIGLTGQMHGLVLLDAAGQVLRPCIMWNDQRTAQQCAAITGKVGARRVLELTGNPVLSGFTAPKVVWVRENEPEIFAQAAKILLPKDYIRYRLSGEYFTDVSDASGMALLNVAKRDWSNEMLEACGIPRSWMAEVTESPIASTRVNAAAAALTGLKEGTPIIAGGGDQAAGAVGCGIIQEGIVSATFGTSGVVFAHSDEYRVEPEGRLHAFCHAVPGKWHLMGVMLSAAGSFQWYRNALGGEEIAAGRAIGEDPYTLLTRAAETAPAGSEGLLFLPYLSGERTPHPDPNARGVFFGLSLRHAKPHLTRSVLEGITFGMRDSLELMRGLGIAPTEVIASGGGAKSPFWRQMMADIFGASITTNNASEGAALGAAILGGVGAGVFDSVESACASTLQETSRVEPESAQKLYAALYERYTALYPALKGEFRALARVMEELG